MTFDTYLHAITTALKRGDATEHTHRPALKALLEAQGGNIIATNEPKRIACGAPDYIVSRGLVPLGYIEAKDVNLDLDDVETSQQLTRYRASLANLILTDYLEFRAYRNGVLTLQASLGKWQKNGTFKKEADGEKAVADLLKSFIDAQVEAIGSPRELAQKMAQLARLIHDLITRAFTDSGEDTGGDLRAQYEGFKQVLIADLTPMQFADMYAQTIAYGLFAARCNHSRQDGAFTRDSAARDLPKTNPFLRRVFQEIAGHNLDARIAWAVDDLALLLDRADMSAILADFGRATRQEDPVIHFYETFLTAYDPKLRETRGVYYTPEPVVSYLVRSVDAILKRDFGLPAGLADHSKTDIKIGSGKTRGGKEILETKSVHRVQILDPAAGTGTFLHAVIEQIRETFKGNAGMWPGYVAEHLLPRLYGFELLIAPYAVAHMKLGLQLKDSGYDFASDERLRVYLTNTLEEAHELQGAFPFAQAIAREASSAAEVKKSTPIMVVLGNPPYSGHSANQGEWIANLLRGVDSLGGLPGVGAKTANYFEVDGAPLGERNPKWLNDDYVKFIRFAQWRIEETGHGVLAFITNHGYLDNPTFRGMRAALMQTFDDLYLLDLHGNSKKKEKTPDGGKDENVFDIQQGVAIGIFIKHAKRQKPKVHVADLYGTRKSKYAWLAEHALENTHWTTLTPKAPYYLYQAENARLLKEYEKYPRLNEAMPLNVLGFQSHRDDFAIAFDRETLQNRFTDMRAERLTDAAFAEKYGVSDNRDWQIDQARKRIRRDKGWKTHLIPCAYRPFDPRWCLFDEAAMDYPRRELKRHVAGKGNLVLNLCRQTKAAQWRHALVSDAPAPAVFVEIKDGSSAFPLWLYPEDTLEGNNQPHANFSPDFLAGVKSKIGRATPEQIFYYLYAILYSPGYRARYAEFLKRDFPRVPLTRDKARFNKLAKLGEQLVKLHLMQGDVKDISRFPVAGSNEIVKVEFTLSTQGELAESRADDRANEAPAAAPASPTGRVYINASQYFDGVPEAVWQYHIGGYQVCHKWLKDRKGRLLSYDEIKHYHGIVAALAKTIELQAEIDAAIPEWPLQ